MYLILKLDIDNRINALTKRIIDYENLENLDDFSNFHKLGTICLDEIFVHGRITTEPLGMRVSSENLYLEGSLDNCRGAKVKLDISNLNYFSFFPGQVFLYLFKIIIAKGVHSSVSTFEVSKIFSVFIYLNRIIIFQI